MKNIIPLLGIFAIAPFINAQDETPANEVVAAPATSTPAGWTDDFEAAKKQAAKEGKYILVDFSGSDWCGWCMRLDEEVFSKQEFKDGVKDKFVLVFIDSPRDRNKLSDLAKKNNGELAKKYAIRGYPSVLLMDAEGKSFAKTGYKKGGPVEYVKHLNELLEKKKAADSGEPSAAPATSTPAGWTDDLEAAKKQAAKEGKHILVDFSGSDWCGWCVRLDEEVFSKQEFKDGVKDKFILVFIDSPRDQNKLSELAKKNNRGLVQKYGVRGFPSVLLLDSDGNAFAKTGYQAGGPVKYLEHLNNITKENEQMIEFYAKLKAVKPNSPERAKLIDSVLGKMDFQKQIEFQNLVEEVLTHDADGKLGMRAHYPFFTEFKPFEAKIKAVMNSLNAEISKAIEALPKEKQRDQKLVFGTAAALILTREKEIAALQAEAAQKAATCDASIKSAFETIKEDIGQTLEYARANAAKADPAPEK